MSSIRRFLLGMLDAIAWWLSVPRATSDVKPPQPKRPAQTPSVTAPPKPPPPPRRSLRVSTEGIPLAVAASMSAEDRETQRRSFAYGNVALSNPDVTRALVDEVAERISAKVDSTIRGAKGKGLIVSAPFVGPFVKYANADDMESAMAALALVNVYRFTPEDAAVEVPSA